ncbi:MAG: hypothetical protein E6J88_08715 [Deltaproteobacteria bacterium]|nr:MAG: hypothetical protein E6J88_08715 [Deltaproteobacteria bacterium]
MNWTSSLLAGFVGTLVLTSLEAGAQQLHLTRMSIPYLLGAAFTPNRDRAKVIGFLVHLINGQLFALLYVAIFDALGEVSILRGAMSIATLEQGPTNMRLIEPPGPLALHYGLTTPLMVIVAHMIFGAIIGWLYHFR